MRFIDYKVNKTKTGKQELTNRFYNMKRATDPKQ